MARKIALSEKSVKNIECEMPEKIKALMPGINANAGIAYLAPIMPFADSYD